MSEQPGPTENNVELENSIRICLVAVERTGLKIPIEFQLGRHEECFGGRSGHRLDSCAESARPFNHGFSWDHKLLARRASR
jgi:hypothetical protein